MALEICTKLIESISQRIQDVITAKGGYTCCSLEEEDEEIKLQSLIQEQRESIEFSRLLYMLLAK
ncbi:hypothetical protein C1645_825009 [Glomus cerebriforme]|uniref:Uncharacterized protein n=1 Tax=Glomus cerebriforme TaxID=658196 RepID=A0A397SXB7_9GLOM|nr:hypothetical protein C1645_825009 [Glomus cerebriforme]